MQIGDKVKWSSQAQGTWKEKRGILKMVLEADQDAHANLPLGLPKSRFKGSQYSGRRRALVEVQRGEKSKLSDYYAPYLSVLELDTESEMFDEMISRKCYGEKLMTKYSITGQHGTSVATVTVSAETPEAVLEDAKQYFPVHMHRNLSVTEVKQYEN